MSAVSSVARRLDGARIVRGTTRYLDDAVPAGCLHVAFARSPHAHALIDAVDLSAAAAAPGVVWALSGKTAAGLIGDLICLLPEALTGAGGPLMLPCLPAQRVRYAGEPVAMVVAETEDAARRAAELVALACTPRPPLLDVSSATAPGAPPQHPQLATNVVMSSAVRDGDAAAALAAAAHAVEGQVRLGRAVPLEPRGCIAWWDDEAGRLVVRAATQQPHGLRAELARQLQQPESDIRVLAPPLGGGFGFKFPGLPEEPLTCLAALHLRRPVRWVETRAESLLVGARDYQASYRVGFDRRGRVTALSVDLDADVGALSATPGPVMPAVAAGTFPGPYDVGHVEVRWRAVMTNKGPWNGARGFGKEATCVVMEAALDDVARVTGLDPAEVRRRNLLRPEQLPHRTSTMTLDSGDYPRALDMALELADYPALRARQARQPAEGPLRTGVGVAVELTPEGIDYAGSLSRGFETATVRLDTSGNVVVLTGVTSPGTGSETAIGQLVASRLGIPVAAVRVIQGDTDRTPYGAGSFSSRAVMTGGTAAWLAAGDLRQQLVTAAAALLGAEPGAVEAAEGLYYVRDEPARAIPLGPLVSAVRTLGAALPGLGGPQVEATRTYGPGNLQSIPDETGRLQQYPAYSYSVHVAAVEVDIETGTTRIERLAAVHDCGTVINQALVDAQLHGAVAMGVGIALFEEERHDGQGRPLATDFKRYLLPRLQDIPELRTGYLESPSPFTELGTKGAGEGGVGGSAAAIAGAVRDAAGGGHLRLPLTPERVLELIDGYYDAATGGAQ
jgi:aerobic carbon-monoxide dehydrogenase large subunit